MYGYNYFHSPKECFQKLALFFKVCKMAPTLGGTSTTFKRPKSCAMRKFTHMYIYLWHIVQSSLISRNHTCIWTILKEMNKICECSHLNPVLPTYCSILHHRSKRQKPPEDGFWECSVCTYRNSPEAYKCDMCDIRKGTSTRYYFLASTYRVY